MKNLFTLLFLVLSINVNAQSNRQRLDDIEDKLDQLIFQQQLNEIDNLRRQNEERRNSRPIQKEIYKNTDSVAERNNRANYYNLSYNEYIRRDEISHNNCLNSSIFIACYTAGVINISLAEQDRRINRALDKCHIGKGTAKEINAMNECTRKIIVLGK